MANIYYKQGVYGDKLDDSIRRVLPKILRCFKEMGQNIVLVTSTNEGNHSAGSFHYVNKAIDLGSPLDRECTYGLEQLLKRELGKDYDVLYHNNHYHCEYDPKD